MKIKLLFTTVFMTAILFVGCEKEAVDVKTELGADELSFVEDEVIADIEFADLIDEADDGTFWGDDTFLSLKSASVEQVVCFTKEVAKEEDKWIVTFVYTGDCGKEGTIIIEYYKPDSNNVTKKTVTYIDFTKRGVTFNGTRHIERGNGVSLIMANLEIDKVNNDGEPVHIVRNYERQVEWLCGLDTRGVVEDNIKQVTGKCEITKTVNDEETSYSRTILEPLLIAKACDLRVQAGVVEIKKANGVVITIDYGQMPDEIDCESEFDCGTTFEVAKDGETYTMEFVNGERVRQSE